MYLTCKTFTEVKEHTWNRNTGSIGIALCCASEAQAAADGILILAASRRQ